MRCLGHSSTVTHLDWSADSSVIQSSDQAYELLYFDPRTGKQVKENQVGVDVSFGDRSVNLRVLLDGLITHFPSPALYFLYLEGHCVGLCDLYSWLWGHGHLASVFGWYRCQCM